MCPICDAPQQAAYCECGYNFDTRDPSRAFELARAEVQKHQPGVRRLTAFVVTALPAALLTTVFAPAWLLVAGATVCGLPLLSEASKRHTEAVLRMQRAEALLVPRARIV